MAKSRQLFSQKSSIVDIQLGSRYALGFFNDPIAINYQYEFLGKVPSDISTYFYIIFSKLAALLYLSLL